MGDRRYDAPYEAIARSSDRAAALRKMGDDEVVFALAAASRRMDAYLANVLAVEVLRRQRRRNAALWGVVVALSAAVIARTILFLRAGAPLWVVEASFLLFLPCALAGILVYRALLWRSARKDAP